MFLISITCRIFTEGKRIMELIRIAANKPLQPAIIFINCYRALFIMSKGYENELAKNALIEIAKIIIETENKISNTIDDSLCELLNDISDKFDTGIGNEVLAEVENSIIHTNCVGELFFNGDKGYRKCRRETSYHKLNEIVVHTASKNNCAKDAFFSEIFKRENTCSVNG